MQIFAGDEGAALKFDYYFFISRGMFQLVWIDKDLNTDVIVESSEFGHREYKLEPGNYMLKVVGKNTSVEGSVAFQAGGDYVAYLGSLDITEDIRATD